MKSTMMRLLRVNHSVQLLVSGERRFVLPSRPCFPQFGPKTLAHKETSAPIMSGKTADNVGARLRRVGHVSDIFDDHTEAASSSHEGAGWGERLKARWSARLDRILHGASKS